MLIHYGSYALVTNEVVSSANHKNGGITNSEDTIVVATQPCKETSKVAILKSCKEILEIFKTIPSTLHGIVITH